MIATLSLRSGMRLTFLCVADSGIIATLIVASAPCLLGAAAERIARLGRVVQVVMIAQPRDAQGVGDLDTLECQLGARRDRSRRPDPLPLTRKSLGQHAA